MYLIGFLVVGVAIGFLAGHVMTGSGYGVFWDMVVGAVGALVCGLVLSLVFGTYETGLIIAFLGAVIVAAVLVAVLHLANREKPRIAH
ncbi:MAG TPA: GlsB/YeaQ/YmgE family stress response membrane protein [Candidatus Dormibacteraeota bacterium]|nr:GlsB/YeaQ/YmgE family stress response membrane protein [Candidatus Dormibacteraeota bacterium]